MPCPARLDLVDWAFLGALYPLSNTVLSLSELSNLLLITRSRLPTNLTRSHAVEKSVRAVEHTSEQLNMRWTMCNAMVKGKLVALALMDRGDGEGQASGLGAEGPKQR